LLAEDKEDLEYTARKIKGEYEKHGMTINFEKSKYLCCIRLRKSDIE
jgi:hypothetical protein